MHRAGPLPAAGWPLAGNGQVLIRTMPAATATRRVPRRSVWKIIPISAARTTLVSPTAATAAWAGRRLCSAERVMRAWTYFTAPRAAGTRTGEKRGPGKRVGGKRAAGKRVAGKRVAGERG